MATPVQEKAILSSSDTTAAAPASQAIAVQIPVIPSQAPSLEGRAQTLDDIVQEFDEQELDDIEMSERFEKVTPEELREIIGWMRDNPSLTLQIRGAAHGIKPSEDVEDGFVVMNSSASIPDQSTVTANDSRPSVMSRVKQSFWSAVSSFYSPKK